MTKDQDETPKIFENTRQVHVYLQDQGWKCAYNTVAKDIKAGKLTARRGGGFTKQTVDQYAMTHLVRRIDAAPEKDKSWEENTMDASGAQERKVAADADLKETMAKREKLRLDMLNKKLIPKELYESDLAARLALFSNSIDVWAMDIASDLAGMFGADVRPCSEIIEKVGGEPGKASELAGWFLARRPEIADMIIKSKQDWLRAFGSSQVQVIEIEDYVRE